MGLRRSGERKGGGGWRGGIQLPPSPPLGNSDSWVVESLGPENISGDLRGIRIKTPGKNPSQKIPLNAVESKPVPTRVLNPNASEANYKPKQRS